MIYRLLADLVFAIHLGFIIFVILGGFLVAKWRWLIWIHVPAALWGALIEFADWPCPLTPLENALRRRAGLPGYQESFIEHYIAPVIYPSGMTPALQIVIGVLVLVVNGIIYWRMLTH